MKTSTELAPPNPQSAAALQTLVGTLSSYLAKLAGSESGLGVALSGGIDSSTLLRAATDLLGPRRVIALTGISPSLSQDDLSRAREAAAQCGVPHFELPTEELQNPDYLRNGPDRCYHCKSTLFDTLSARLPNGWTMLEGTTKDDLDGHRPGFKAGNERGVRSPFAENGIEKVSVRAMAQHLGVPDGERPASPCLSSRVQYGQAIDAGLLTRIGEAEASLKRMGFERCRVRAHDAIARIEVPLDRLGEACARHEAILRQIRESGFTYATLDLGGLRSGSLLEVLPEESLPDESLPVEVLPEGAG